jgi:ribosomal protein S18 acetylase RimI-like enzyme
LSKIEIIDAISAADYAAGRTLIEEYAAALNIDLCFQNFSDEVANLSGIYGPPRGCLLLARVDGDLAGCVAVRSHEGDICEMKRLYVRPTCRGAGLGRRLADAAVLSAEQLGYSQMVLDTLSSMVEALAIYEALGFREIEAYYPNPLERVRYLGRELTRQ